MKKVTVGLIGSGFAAELHLSAYPMVHGVEIEIKAVSSISNDLKDFAEKFQIRDTYQDYKEMLKDPDIDVVDVIVPPALHEQCIRDALSAGKHVICEKPLTGYFEERKNSEMLQKICEQTESLKEFVQASGKKFMYAENWIYAPSVQKSAQILMERKGKQLFLKAEESHSGSHAKHAAYWKMNGGGSLIRQGCHPISSVLYLKSIEGAARGEDIQLKSVTCDVGNVTGNLPEKEKQFIESRPVDVEDWACAVYTFTDDTKAVVLSGDMVLGGVRNYVECYGNNFVLLNNISPNNAMQTFFTDEHRLENVYITEKTQLKSGWQSVFLDETVARGYAGELQDFMECVAYDREPISGIELASQTVKAIYGAYQSAAEGKTVYF